MSEDFPESQPHPQTVNDCLAITSGLGEFLVLTRQMYQEIAEYASGLHATYQAVEGTESVNAAMADIAFHVAQQAESLVSPLEEMNDNLIARLQALST